MTDNQSKEIVGAEIQAFTLDPEYWEKVILRLKDTGLRTVSTYVPWGRHAVGPPDKEHPAGMLDFEGKTDPRLNLFRFLELIEKHGLNLNFRLGPFCCNEMVYGGYPGWLVMGEPGMMVWDYQNRTTQGYWIAKKEGSQPSYLHPEYLSWCERWIGEVAKVVVPHLKANGGCITMLNLDNEVSYIVQDGFLSSDYNPVNVRPGGFYHQFLTGKYGSAANLPYAANYNCIEDVPAPRSIPEEIGQDLAYYIDWCEFKTWVMTEYLRRLREMCEANGVRDITFMTNLNPHRPEGVPTRVPAFEEATQGIVGYDFYRGTFMSYSGYHSMARILKLMNASLNYTWSPEFMAGTWNKVLKTRVSDDHMRFMAQCALAHGCKAIGWFMFHDRHCWGDSPVSSHGHPRPSLGVLSETHDILFNKIRSWDSLRPQGDVAVIYDLIQHQHTYLGDPMPCDDNDLHIGKPLINGVEAGRASQEYEGLFRLVEQAGCQADVIDIMHSSDGLSNYPLVLLPGSPVIETAASQALGDYVRRGGVLVLCGPWPEMDEHGRSAQFLGLSKPDQSKPVMELVVGNGKLVWHSEYLGQDPPEEESIRNMESIASLIDSCVPKPAVRLRVAQKMTWVDWKQDDDGQQSYHQPRNLGSAVLHLGADEAVLFVLNHYPEAALFEVELGNPKYTKMVNLTSGESILLQGGKAQIDLDRKSAQIYRLE